MRDRRKWPRPEPLAKAEDFGEAGLALAKEAPVLPPKCPGESPRPRGDASARREARHKRPAILALLERGGYLRRGARHMVERYMELWNVSDFHAVLETHLLTETKLADALASSLKIDRVFNLQHRQLDDEAARRLGFARARQWECLPIIHDFNNLEGVELVVADPTQEERIAQLRAELGTDVTLAVAERSVIVSAIDELFPLAAQLPTLFDKA